MGSLHCFIMLIRVSRFYRLEQDLSKTFLVKRLLLLLIGFGSFGLVTLYAIGGRETPETSHSVANGHRYVHSPSGEIELDPANSILKRIEYGTVKNRLLPMVVEATGQLQANASAVTRVSAPTAGRIVSLEVSLGDHVKKGQTVAVISSQEIGGLVTDLFKQETDIESELSRELLQIDFEIMQNETELDLSRKQFERAKLLFEEKIASKADMESAHTNLRKHENSVVSLKDKRASTIRIASERRIRARVALEQKLSVLGMPNNTIRTIMERRDIVNSIPLVSPQTGIVLERNVNSGELVDPSQSLLVIDDIDNLWLVADVFEQDVKHVRVGQPIEFYVDSFPDERFKGRLDYVAGTINPETRTLAVRAIVPNSELKLKPKMFARMKIMVGQSSALTVEKKAVQEAGSQKVVYIPRTEFSFEERPVQVEDEVGGYVIIKKGLSEGDRVVTRESLSLRSLSMNTWH